MINIEIPIYRAKKINSNNYVEGYFYKQLSHNFILESCEKKQLEEVNIWGAGWDTFQVMELSEVDPTTLAIHHQGMLDSGGNKIFASLSEDGLGGDYINSPLLPVTFLWDSLNACVCLKGRYEYTSLFKDGSTNQRISTFSNYKVIGIKGENNE